MARQSTKPVAFNRSQRKDTSVTMSSGRAGVVVPVGYFPLLPGDSASGRMGIDLNLAEMPRPLLNGVMANVQAWFVPKSAFPQFAGQDELRAALAGTKIKALGQADRNPPNYFYNLGNEHYPKVRNSELYRTLGIHVPNNDTINTDLIDAFNLIYNFRLQAHSSKLKRRPYAIEDIQLATKLPRAFWPSSRFSSVVPNYERALVVGALDLDVAAGRLPVSGIGVAENVAFSITNAKVKVTNGKPGAPETFENAVPGNWPSPNQVFIKGGHLHGLPQIWAEMAGRNLRVTLADIDKARTTQAFAKLRTAYAGNDSTGFDNDHAIVSMLMQGIEVEIEEFKRPWLLDSARVPVGFAERFASDGANLDSSVTTGRASASLSLNIPKQETGGVVVFTLEVLPERIDERMTDEWLLCSHVDHLPNALRDIQRPEPVDLVRNQRLDAMHSKPKGLYGYEPMNMKWNRDFTRLGGKFFDNTPGRGYKETRAAIWQAEIVNPAFRSTHYLAPYPFPHSVFADQRAPAFEFVCRHAVAINGLTQIGDPLAEHNSEYREVVTEE